MQKKPAGNKLDGAVPKSSQMGRLREGEKKALELGDEAEHSHGEKRERLTKDAQDAAERDAH